MIDNYGRWYPDYPGQQPYQDPAYMRAIGQPVQPHAGAPAPGAAQDMTPTIHADIKQVESEEAINRIHQEPGTTRAYMTRNEQVIVFRTMHANGEYSDKTYDERPPAPPAPVFRPEEYVRRDELEKAVAGILAAQTPPRRAIVQKGGSAE